MIKLYMELRSIVLPSGHGRPSGTDLAVGICLADTSKKEERASNFSNSLSLSLLLVPSLALAHSTNPRNTRTTTVPPPHREPSPKHRTTQKYDEDLYDLHRPKPKPSMFLPRKPRIMNNLCQHFMNPSIACSL